MASQTTRTKKRFFLFGKSAPEVPVIRLAGAIGVRSGFKSGLSLEALNPVLEKAFARKNIAAVALAINSPGGAAVQSLLIHNRIRQLAGKHKVKVIAFCEDVAASGGYMLACAGDEIIADKSSIIGSIGVIAASFGFTGAIEKLGIERRVYTAGRNKSMLDPFMPEKAEDVDRLKALQLEVHDEFIALVKSRRAGKLKDDAPDLFTGEFWSGGRALTYGLIDGTGQLHQVLAERYGKDVRLLPMSKKRGFGLARFMSSAPAVAHSSTVQAIAGLATGSNASGLTQDVLNTLEARALWQRYGL